MLKFFFGSTTWNVPPECSRHFPETGSHLERYAAVLNAVEINSSFYRHHKAATYARWAATVPAHFRFAVKLSKHLTHELKLDAKAADIKEAIAPILSLGRKLGALLVQLPPKLEFNAAVATRFFTRLRKLYTGAVVVEPRHPSWLSVEAAEVLRSCDLHRVIADPDPFAKLPGLPARAFSRVAYFRLHGSPVIYKSKYEDAQLRHFAKLAKAAVRQGCDTIWFIFDNSTFGHATADALAMKNLIAAR